LLVLQVHLETLEVLEILDNLDLQVKLVQQELWEKGDLLDHKVCRASLVLQEYQVCQE